MIGSEPYPVSRKIPPHPPEAAWGSGLCQLGAHLRVLATQCRAFGEGSTRRPYSFYITWIVSKKGRERAPAPIFSRRTSSRPSNQFASRSAPSRSPTLQPAKTMQSACRQKSLPSHRGTLQLVPDPRTHDRGPIRDTDVWRQSKISIKRPSTAC